MTVSVHRLKILFAVCINAGFAQIPPPKHESRFHHLFSPHREGEDLEHRFVDLSCAVVVLQSGNRMGTGFYVNADGDVVTASHVLGDRTFAAEGNQVRVTLHPPERISVRDHNGDFTVPSTNIESNADQWSADVAVLKTAHHTSCWFATGDVSSVRAGQHAVALGFPGLAFGSLSLYAGIVSARLRSDLVVGSTASGQPLRGATELFRVQMPISPGISGGPVIDDENRVIAVVVSAGAWSPVLESLTEAARRGGIPALGQNTGMNLLNAVAQLATIFHDYASPGYGDAVPMSYLGR